MIVENLATNPSFEAASSTVTVRTNLCTNPRVGVDLSTIAAPAVTPPAVYVQNPFTGDYLLAQVDGRASKLIREADQRGAMRIQNGWKF